MEDPLADAETLKLGEDGSIVELGKKPTSYDEIQGQYVRLSRGRASASSPETLATFADWPDEIQCCWYGYGSRADRRPRS